MPRAAKKPCKKPGCPNLTNGGYCEAHKSDARKDRAPDTRPSAQARGYGRRWRRLRKMVLARQPLCEDCIERGQVTPASEVHHIVPRVEGGPDSFENLQALCKPCHSRKTGRAQRRQVWQCSTIPVTIVCGPPGSGKTTLVRERASVGDLIVDVDALFAALSGCDWYDKPAGLLPFVMEARDAVIRRLARESEVRRAWIITAESDYAKLQAMKQQLGAKELLLLDVSANECLRRISRDKRREERWELWEPIVNGWWRTFESTKLRAET